MIKIVEKKRTHNDLTISEEYILQTDEDEYNDICDISIKRIKSYENDKILKKK